MHIHNLSHCSPTSYSLQPLYKHLVFLQWHNPFPKTQYQSTIRCIPKDHLKMFKLHFQTSSMISRLYWPESPWHESLPPEGYPAQIIFAVISIRISKRILTMVHVLENIYGLVEKKWSTYDKFCKIFYNLLLICTAT